MKKRAISSLRPKNSAPAERIPKGGGFRSAYRQDTEEAETGKAYVGKTGDEKAAGGKGEKNRPGQKREGQWNRMVLLKFAIAAAAVFGLFFLGRAAGYVSEKLLPASAKVQEQADNWGLGFGAEGTQPTGNVSAEELKKYDAYYLGTDTEKVIYLTFDCGYENDNTAPILDALKKHNAPAAFFVVGHYLETAPDMVKRMVEEGHTVGNHTYHHPDMSAISSKETFQKEMDDVAALYEQVTGGKMLKYYRPPQGKYSMENLKMAQDLGYKTFFWSLAYVDWNQDSQPTKEEAFQKLLGRIHPGAVVLLHNTSKTNGEILDELLTKWEEMGYGFHPLSELCNE